MSYTKIRLEAVDFSIIITFINRIIQNCAIHGNYPIFITNIYPHGNRFYIEFDCCDDIKADIEPFISMLKDENLNFVSLIKEKEGE